jgi:hypothetical protein
MTEKDPKSMFISMDNASHKTKYALLLGDRRTRVMKGWHEIRWPMSMQGGTDVRM